MVCQKRFSSTALWHGIGLFRYLGIFLKQSESEKQEV